MIRQLWWLAWVGALIGGTLLFGRRWVAAADPFQAIQLCTTSEETIDLLLTDLVMPQFDGFQLARRISSLRPGIKILYMSGYSERTGNIPMDDLDAGKLIQKPFTLDELLNKIAGALAA